jgi:hypothetical protein
VLNDNDIWYRVCGTDNGESKRVQNRNLNLSAIVEEVVFIGKSAFIFGIVKRK